LVVLSIVDAHPIVVPWQLPLATLAAAGLNVVEGPNGMSAEFVDSASGAYAMGSSTTREVDCARLCSAACHSLQLELQEDVLCVLSCSIALKAIQEVHIASAKRALLLIDKLSCPEP
jgi:hypothetical protein